MDRRRLSSGYILVNKAKTKLCVYPNSEPNFSQSEFRGYKNLMDEKGNNTVHDALYQTGH